MLKLNTHQKLWAIAHEHTDMTGRLFDDRFFTFRHHAEHEIEEIRKLFAEEDGVPMPDGRLYPVLLVVTAICCQADEAATYDAEQAAWLAEHGQAAKRRKREQAHAVV